MNSKKKKNMRTRNRNPHKKNEDQKQKPTQKNNINQPTAVDTPPYLNSKKKKKQLINMDTPLYQSTTRRGRSPTPYGIRKGALALSRQLIIFIWCDYWFLCFYVSDVFFEFVDFASDFL